MRLVDRGGEIGPGRPRKNRNTISVTKHKRNQPSLVTNMTNSIRVTGALTAPVFYWAFGALCLKLDRSHTRFSRMEGRFGQE